MANADSTIDSELFTLQDNWPDTSGPSEDVPTDGFTGADGHNVVAAKYPIGQKVRVWNDSAVAGKDGFSTFIYLKVGTQNASVVLAVKSVVVSDSATVWYEVTNDPDDNVSMSGGLCAIALSAMTNAYYGWFWCGGVCPEAFVSGLAGNYATNGTIIANSPIGVVDLTADAVGLGLVGTSSIVAFPFFVMTDIAATGDVVTTFTPGFAGIIEKTYWIQGTVVSTGSRDAILNFEIGTTNVTGGAVTLASASLGTVGVTIAGAEVTAENEFTATDTISVEATVSSAFAEGAGTLYAVIRSGSRAAVGSAIADDA